MTGWDVLSKTAVASRNWIRRIGLCATAQALFSETIILASLTNNPGGVLGWIFQVIVNLKLRCSAISLKRDVTKVLTRTGTF